MIAPEKVLVVGPSWVGDMVMAQALYRLLKQRSTSEIHVVAPPWSLPVIERMPEVARGIELAVGHGELGLRRRRSLGIRLRGEGYSRAIVLPRSAKAALVPWFARIPRRTGFLGEWRYGLLNDIRTMDASLDQTAERFVALGRERNEASETLRPDLYPSLRASGANLARLRADHALDARDGLVALMPGAEYGAAKRWPAPRFAELAAWLAGAGTNVVILGSEKERALGDEIVVAAGKPRVRNLCGQTSLADAIDLLAAADAAVSNDSGLLHVAAATGTPVVAIYGSSSPKFTPPLTESAAVIYLGIECSPCFRRECPLGHLRCLTEISVERVEAALAQLKRARASRTGARADA